MSVFAPKIHTIESIKTHNRNVNHYFFDTNTLRCFNSRILSDVYDGPGGVYFVTSEKQCSLTYTYPRLYTVREYNPISGFISTKGNFPGFETARAAKAYAKKCAAGIDTTE